MIFIIHIIFIVNYGSRCYPAAFFRKMEESTAAYPEVRGIRRFVNCNATLANTRIYSDFSIRFVLKMQRNAPKQQ